MPEKAVPISAATVSVPGFSIRFNEIASRLIDRTVARPGERVDLIKIDIQGYELHALQGAKRILEENREIKLLLEFWPYGLKQAGAEWDHLIEMLRGFGTDLMLIGANGLIPFNARAVRSDVGWYVNLFASCNAGRVAIA